MTAEEKLEQIEDIVVNHYEIEDEPFSQAELKRILDAIVEVLDDAR